MMRKVLQAAGAIAMIAVVSVVEKEVVPVNATTVALSFVLTVLAVATWWGLAEAVAGE